MSDDTLPAARRSTALATLTNHFASSDTINAASSSACLAALAVLEAHLEENELATEELRALRNAAEASLARLGQFRTALPLPLFVLDSQLQVVDTNPTARALFGLDPSNPIERPTLRRALGRDDAHRLLQRLPRQRTETSISAGRFTLALTPERQTTAEIFLHLHEVQESEPLHWTALLVPDPPAAANVALLTCVLDGDDDAVCITSPTGVFVYSNLAFQRIVDRPIDEIVGRTWHDILPPDAAALQSEGDERTGHDGLRAEHHDAWSSARSVVPLELHWIKRPLYDDTGTLLGVATRLRDTTGHAEVAAAQALSELVFQHASDAIAVTDPLLHLRRVNPAFERLVGFPAERLDGMRLDRLGLTVDSRHYLDLRSDLDLRGFWAGELPLQTISGNELIVWCSIARLNDSDGVSSGFVAVYTDLTALRAVHAENEKLAQYDDLTGLPNRSTITRLLEQAIRTAQRRGESFAVAFVDLDHFKNVNDNLGHSVGDHLLRLAATRLRDQLRPTDTVARIGGDEFVILMPNVDATTSVVALERIRTGFQTPLDLSGHTEYRATLSIGVALYPLHATQAEELLRYADTAMYAAKAAGRDRVQRYDPSMGEATSRAFDLRNAVLTAIENDELELYFQPLFDLHDRSILGAEVLVRWHRPGHGLVPPSEFLPALELAGRMVDLDRWVFRTALAIAARWHAESRLRPDWVLSINQTSMSVQEPGWITHLTDVLDEVGFRPSRGNTFPITLQLELTEDHLAEPVPEVLRNLNALRAMGLSLAIDDFGTGYSNLSYLRTLPVSTLKIDRSFVPTPHCEPNADTVLEAIILMGKKLGYAIVAEGVETDDQAARLHQLGCHVGQGYLVSPPVPHAEFARRFLARSNEKPENG